MFTHINVRTKTRVGNMRALSFSREFLTSELAANDESERRMSRGFQ